MPNTLSNRFWKWWVVLEEQTEPFFPGPCGRSKSFFQLLLFASSRETSDERDRVYALHSLFEGRLSQSLLPDYRRPILDLACNAVRKAFVDLDGRTLITAFHYVY